MKLFDFLFKRRKEAEQERLVLEQAAIKVSLKLGQQFSYNRMRRMYSSKDGIIAVTPTGRLLFHPSRMRGVGKKDLLFQANTAGDSRNIFPRRHFEAIADAFDWKFGLYMGKKGNAPALFKLENANIWLSPIIMK